MVVIMIKIGITRTGFKIYDYKNGTTCEFLRKDDNEIKVNFNRKYLNQKYLFVKIESKDDKGIIDILSTIYDEQIREINYNNKNTMNLGLYEHEIIDDDQQFEKKICCSDGEYDSSLKKKLVFIKNNQKNEYVLALEDSTTFSDNFNIINNLYDVNFFSSYLLLIEKVRKMPFLLDKYIKEDFDTYFTDRNWWLKKHLMQIQQLEKCFLYSSLSELDDLKRNVNRIIDEKSFLKGVDYVIENLRTISSLIDEKDSLIDTDIEFVKTAERKKIRSIYNDL